MSQQQLKSVIDLLGVLKTQTLTLIKDQLQYEKFEFSVSLIRWTPMLVRYVFKRPNYLEASFNNDQEEQANLDLIKRAMNLRD